MKFISRVFSFTLVSLVLSIDLTPNHEIQKPAEQSAHPVGSIQNNDKITVKHVFEGGSQEEKVTEPAKMENIRDIMPSSPGITGQPDTNSKNTTSESFGHEAEQIFDSSAGFWEILGAFLIIFGMYYLAAKLGLIANSMFSRKYEQMENPEMYNMDDDNEHEVLRRQYL